MVYLYSLKKSVINATIPPSRDLDAELFQDIGQVFIEVYPFSPSRRLATFSLHNPYAISLFISRIRLPMHPESSYHRKE